MKDKNEAFFNAVAVGDTDKVGSLLEEAPELAGARDAEGRTPVLLALYFGHREMAELIGDRVPELNLYEASAMGEIDTVREWIEEDPDSLSRSAPDGFGPLGLAVFFGQEETAKALLDAGADPDKPADNSFEVRPIHSAAANRDPDKALSLARLLVEWDAEIDVVQGGGWTPLHQAAAHGNRKLVEFLLEKGASPEVQGERGLTPAQVAKAKGHDELSDLLGGVHP